MRRTKIICTVGPATSSPTMLESLAAAGMNVARLNFSHGSHEFHAQTIDTIQRLRVDRNMPVAVLQDLCGPKIRLGMLPPEGLEVQAGQEVTFVATDSGDNIHEIPLPVPMVFAIVRTGEPLLINDGRVKFVVTGRTADTIRAQATIGGVLLSRKGVNLPQTHLPMTSVTEKDLIDLRFGLKHGVDWVAVSFVRSVLDIEPVQRTIEAAGAKTRVIAKIEKREALDDFDNILKAADGILIARGDMGVELPMHEVPLIQKDIIRRCNEAGKPVITATQMLESMIDAPDPTRAEATDVANSILDGTDAIMLSGETAVGHYPIEAVKVMRDIALETEQVLPRSKYPKAGQPGDLSVTESVAASVCRIATEVDAKAIFCNTSSGGTARSISKYRPYPPIIAFTPEESTQYQLSLSWGVQPCLIPTVHSSDEMMVTVVNTSVERGLVEKGDKVVITSGVPIGMPGSTSLIKVHTIGQAIVA
ncbi:pyruvate kinase [Baaleninema sp.]|uniref:pyruvate kinase n=1 Tax=Baaleninema sp. TaxID=3101197 RepID=UPI003D01DD3B